MKKINNELIENNKYIYEIAKNDTLEMKIKRSIRTIKEFYNKNNGNVYISYSGGKDSTVLLHLINSVYPEVKSIFFNTGNEYPENISMAKFHNSIFLTPKINFKQVIEKYGYPIISKEVSQFIYEIKNNKNGYKRLQTATNINCLKNTNVLLMQILKFLLNVANILKKILI